MAAYTLHAASVRQQQENAYQEELADHMTTEPSFSFSDEDKEGFKDHMTKGITSLVKPVEDAITAKTQEIFDSQVLIKLTYSPDPFKIKL